MDISAILKSATKIMCKHSPEILTGLGIAGMVSATVMAVRATPVAIKRIEETKKEEKKESLTVGETLKATWTCYIPTAIASGVSIACLVGSTRISVKRHSALMAAYALTETTLKEYQEQVIQTIGEKKEKEVRDNIAQTRMGKDPITNHEIIATPRGTTQCYDYYSGRYFMSDIETIKQAMITLNHRMLRDNYVSLNEFYYEIDLEGTQVGNTVGWKVDGGKIDVVLSSKLASDNTPCVVVNYSIPPTYDYDR